MNTLEFIKHLVSELVPVRTLLTLATVSPLVIAGLRNSCAPDRWRLIGLSALVVFLTNSATGVDSIFGIRQPDWLHWNWIGKLACVVTVALIVGLLPAGMRQKTGIFSIPSTNSALPVFVSLFSWLMLEVIASVPSGSRVDGETLAFQLTMPSLAEEPVFRAILPALLGAALGSPWKIMGAQLGWWWLAISAYFGLGHAMDWTSSGGLEFHAVPFFLTGIVGLWFGWLAARCGSVWPCVIGHSILNSTTIAIAMLSK